MCIDPGGCDGIFAGRRNGRHALSALPERLRYLLLFRMGPGRSREHSTWGPEFSLHFPRPGVWPDGASELKITHALMLPCPFRRLGTMFLAAHPLRLLPQRNVGAPQHLPSACSRIRRPRWIRLTQAAVPAREKKGTEVTCRNVGCAQQVLLQIEVPPIARPPFAKGLQRHLGT